MAKKNYTPADYAQLLEWGLKAYIPTELYVDSGNQCTHILLNGESVGLDAKGMRIRFGMDGLLIFSAELLFEYDEEDAAAIFEILNESNRRSGITLYIDHREVVSYLCARQELYMDYMTLAAAKRTATRIILAVYDWKNALTMLADRLPEYFSEEALEAALQEGQRILKEWQDSEKNQHTLTEEEISEYLESLDSLSEWDEGEELPF